MSARTMSLLEDLYATALRSDYPTESIGSADPSPRPSSGVRALTLVTVVAVGFILAVAAVTVLRERPTTTAQREQLLTRILDAEATNASLDAEISTRTTELDALTAARIPDSVEGTALRARLSEAETAAGYTDVSGAGISVILADAQRADALHRVLDRDLQALVNGMWAAGAQAVAVNGVRLTTLTAIRSAGEAILVDYRPLVGPYTVIAVGDDLEARLAESSEGGALRALKDQFGIGVDIVSGAVTVPASNAALRARSEVAQ